MKRILKILLCVAGMVLSCENNNIEKVELKDGTYTGVFYRTSPTADWMVSNVTLTLDNGSFAGESEIAKYPAICRGKYLISGLNVEFTNECHWTAEFDWTLILSGNFKITGDNSEIVLTRWYDEHTFDTYKLRYHGG